MNITEKEKILALLRRGPLKASNLAEELKKSQATLSRLLSQIPEVVRIGKARKTQYALHRTLDDIPASIPVYEVQETGKVEVFGTLHSIQPEGFLFDTKKPMTSDKVIPFLPYFLSDLRPMGFLGRLIPKQFPELQLPTDIVTLNANQCLRYLTKYGWNNIGNLIVGEHAYQHFLKQMQSPSIDIVEKNKAKIYAQRATEVMSMGIPGSSAAGEQPKFLGLKDNGDSVIVKFSPLKEDKQSLRIADLLVCEHIAHGVLKEQNISSCDSQIIESQNRIFLEVKRFDRTKQGRKGMLSLQAIDEEFVGGETTWVAVALGILKHRLISQNDYQQILWLNTFGKFIANSDMHLGNLSFFFQNRKLQGLTPSYDMTSMFYAPVAGHLTDKIFEPPTPNTETFSVWESTRNAAAIYWEAISKNKLITKEFRAIAKENLDVVQKMKELNRFVPSSHP